MKLSDDKFFGELTNNPKIALTCCTEVGSAAAGLDSMRDCFFSGDRSAGVLACEPAELFWVS